MSEETSSPKTKSDSRQPKRLLFAVLAVLVFLVDQLTKAPFRSHWQVGQSSPLLSLGDWGFALTYVQNTGSLFGMFQGNAFLLGLVSLTIACGIVGYTWKLEEDQGKLPYITLGILLGGALGNMLDRLRHGFVVDMFDLQHLGRNAWPVFNVADIAVDIAIGLFVLMAIQDMRKDMQKNKTFSETPAAPSEAAQDMLEKHD